MKIKTADLIGPALDWAVAVAQGDTPVLRLHTNSKGATIYRGTGFRENGYDFAPSVRGDTVIDIMEQEGISAMTASGHKGDRKWAAWQGDPPVLASEEITGPTLRIAVCRSFVASKLGDEVDMPKELMP